MSLELQAMREYVTAKDATQYDGMLEGLVAVYMTHNLLTMRAIDLRLDLASSIANIKNKLYTHCGTKVGHMRLFLRSDGVTLCEMADDDRPLGYYGVENGMEIHVVDEDPYSLAKNGGLEDVSLVKKYEMTDEDYDKYPKSLRAYVRERRKVDPNFKLFPKGDATAPKQDVESPECISHITLGSRCEIQPGGRRGSVEFVGQIPALAAGYWVGVRLDEPVGKSDGTVKGKRYFECSAGYGSFVRPFNVTCGDYPEEDLLLSEDEDGGCEEAGGCCSGTGTTTATTTTTTTATDSVTAPKEEDDDEL